MDWIVESGEGDILHADLAREQALEMARRLVEEMDEPMSEQERKSYISPQGRLNTINRSWETGRLELAFTSLSS